jgi:hypothetical protein
MRKVLAALIVVFAALSATADPVPKSDGVIRSASPSQRTIATLPTCNTAAEGRSFKVTDATSASSCTVGGGSNNHVCTCQQSAYIAENPAGGGSSAFSAITGGTNTTAAMVVGTGSSLDVSGTGTNAATLLKAVSGPDIQPISSATCASGFFHDLDSGGSGDRDNSENCVDASRVFHADSYVAGSTTAGINEAIAACGKGSGNANLGCVVWLPKGEKTITTTIKIGDVVNIATDYQQGVILMGHGSGYEPSAINYAGTTLTWGGANGGTMMQVVGFNHQLLDFALDGNGEAGFGIRLTADNGLGLTTGKGIIRSVTIEDVLDTTVATQGWGIAFDSEGGGGNNGQNDHWVVEQVQIRDSRHCLRQSETQAIQNRIVQLECANWTASPGILVQRGGISFYDFFLGGSLANSVGIQVDSCATVTRFDEASVEWTGDNGTVIKYSDTGLGCGSGAAYPHHLGRVRFQMQVNATTEHTCVEHNSRASLTMVGNTWSSNSADAARKCDIELNNPDATRASPVYMAGNLAAWNYGADLSDVAINVTSTGGGPKIVDRHDLGTPQTITPEGVNTEPWKRYDRWYDWTSGLLWNGTTLSKVANRCQGSQRVIQGLQAVPNGPFRGYIGGTPPALVPISDYKLLSGSPSMRACIFISGPGASPDADGYPSDTAATSSNLNFSIGQGNIEWALNPLIDNSAQSVWSEFIRIGNSDRTGFVNNTASDISTYGTVNNLSMSGYIFGTTNTDRDQDGGIDPIVVGEMPLPQFHRTGAKSTTHVWWHEAGQVTRGDFGQLRRYFYSQPHDMDDFGVSHSWQGWINNYGETEMYWGGVGIYGFGNWDGVTEGGELAGNQFGIVLDDLKTSGVQHAWSSCASGFCADRSQAAGGIGGVHKFSGMTVEGNRINEIAVGVGSSYLFDHVWTEGAGTTGAGTAGTGGSSTVIDNLTGTTFSTDGDTVGAILWNITDDSWCRIATVTDSNTATCVAALTPSGSFDNGDSILFSVTKGDSILIGAGMDSSNRVCSRDDQWAASTTCSYTGASSTVDTSVRFKGGIQAGDGNWPGRDGVVLGPHAVNDATNASATVFLGGNNGGSDTDTSDTTFTMSAFVANAASKTRVDLTENFSAYNHPPPTGHAAYTRSALRKTPRMITSLTTSPGEVFWADEVVIVANGNAAGDCDPGAPTGTFRTLCYWTGSVFAVVGDGAVALDLNDDASDESTGVIRINTANDNGGTDSVVQEVTANEILIDMNRLWPGGTPYLYELPTDTNWLIARSTGVTDNINFNPAKSLVGATLGAYQRDLDDNSNCWISEGATADGNELLDCHNEPTGSDSTWNRIATGGTFTYVALEAVQSFNTGTKTVTAKFDFGGGTLEIPNSTTLPGTCVVGEQYMDTDATTGQRHYLCEAANTWALQGDGVGAGGGDSILVNGAAVADGSGVDFLNGLGVSVALATGASPDTATLELAYAQTLAGNPAIAVSGAAFSDDCPGGGFLSEGSTANTNEQLHCFPSQDGVDTTDYIASADSTGAALTGDSLVGFFAAGKTWAQLMTEFGISGTALDTGGNATFTSVTTTPISLPLVALRDLDGTDDEDNARFEGNLTATGTGAEDMDVALTQQVNGAFVDAIRSVAEGAVTVGNASTTTINLAKPAVIDASDAADSGAVRLDNAEALAWEASPAGTDVTMAADASEIVQITGGTLDGADLTSGSVGTTQVAALDISADTNLGAVAPIVISGDSVTTSMATARMIGRTTGGAGVMQEIVVDDSLTLAALDLSRAALTGEVTAAAGGNATTISDSVAVSSWTLTAPTIAAGTASAGTWPTFASGTVLTTAEDGAWEADANVHYLTTDAGNRGYSPAIHICRLDADYTLTSATTEQKLFNCSANGRITLETGLYQFRALILVTAMSATSGNAAFDLLGTGGATIAQPLYHVVGLDTSTPATGASNSGTAHQTAQTGAAMVSVQTGTGLYVNMFGTFEISVAGTIQPAITLLTAAAAVVEDGSFFEVWRTGSTTAAVLGQWD